MFNAVGFSLFYIFYAHPQPLNSFRILQSSKWRLISQLKSFVFIECIQVVACVLLMQFIVHALCFFFRRSDSPPRVFSAFTIGRLGFIVLLFPWLPAGIDETMAIRSLAFCLGFGFVTLLIGEMADHPALRRRQNINNMPAFITKHLSLCIIALSLLINLIPFFKLNTTIDGFRDYLLTGDQPFYLHISESIVKDGDIDLSNNLLPVGVYHEVLNPPPHTVDRHNPSMDHASAQYKKLLERNGSGVYSTHRCGTSLFVAPFYALGSLVEGGQRPAVMLILFFIVALGYREIALLGISLGVPATACFVFTGLAMLTVPAVTNSSAIYPETLMFFIVPRCVRLLMEQRDTWKSQLEMGLWCAFSPWLQDKYMMWLAPLFICHMWLSLRKKSPRVLIACLPIALSGCLIIIRNLFLYDQMLPRSGPLGTFLSPVEALQSGLSGLWFDWGYGLISLVPVTILWLAGVIIMFRRAVSRQDKWIAAAIFLSFLSAYLVIGSWYCWHGGFAPPNRFSFSFYPLILLWSIVASHAYWKKGCHWVGTLWLLTVLYGLFSLLYPEYWYSRNHPAYEVAKTLFSDVFITRYPPLENDSFAQNIIVSFWGLGVFLFLALIPYLSRFLRKTGYALLFLSILCLNDHPCPIQKSYAETDIITDIGVIHDAAICCDDGSCVFECDFIPFCLEKDLYQYAVSIHLQDKNRQPAGQADFDLGLAFQSWLKNREENRRIFDQQGRFHITRILPDTQAESLEAGLYYPLSKCSFQRFFRSSVTVFPIMATDADNK